ncbi:hypothetical protein [Nonomuraea sp. NPDC050540]|uniref:hypothetical protein n=1 Tax=Nonomuraea sp. NPDC050540 TaxID=3364367 RepID=UPI0037A44E56
MSDHAARGRLRRLVLAALGPPLVVLVPMVLVATLGERLPERVTVHSWSFGTRIGFTWQEWSAQPVFGMMVWAQALLAVAFLTYWHVPLGQRLVVALGWTVGLLIPVAYGLWALGLTSSLGGEVRLGWPMAAQVAGTVAAFALGWVVAGPLPRHPETDVVPPPWLRAMPIGAAQRVMFVAWAWSVRRLVSGAMLVGLAMWLGFWPLLAWAVFEAAQARTRLQIDAGGLSVTLPWLGLRRTVPWTRVRHADVTSEPPKGRYKLDDGSWGWGALAGKGPVLVVSLSDDRRLVYSTSQAGTAAALVNGWLHRLRAGSC